MTIAQDFETQVVGLIEHYAIAKGLYDKSKDNAELRGDALNRMADALQLQGVALQNYLNYLHLLREYRSEKHIDVGDN